MFGELQPLRDRAIPSDLRIKSGYRAIPIDLTGLAHSEPLVDASSVGLAGANFYASARNPPYYHPIPGAIDRLLLRETVVKRLSDVNKRLSAADLELWLFDGWRPQAVQTYFHDQWFPEQIRLRNPGISDQDLVAEVEMYWAAPSAGEDAPSPHSTGGAVDLTIRWRGGDPVWMGSLFDDASVIAHTAHFETRRADHFSFSAEEARANRRLLFWLMTEAGFASNPSEWWHFSYGDQMWAQATGASAALYGGTSPAA